MKINVRKWEKRNRERKTAREKQQNKKEIAKRALLKTTDVAKMHFCLIGRKLLEL
jgi:hypothetical protein